MKNRKNFVKLCIILLYMICIGVFCPKMVVFAGGINGNEARVIAAASGTFTYEGRTYRAQSSYINALNVYLSRDSVDLTAAQASEVIGQMYGSVTTGINNGYLYEVESATEESTGTSSTETGSGEDGTTEITTEITTETATETGTEEETGAGGETTEEGLTPEEALESMDVWEIMDHPTEAGTTLQQRPEEESASVLVELDKDDVVVTTKEDEKIIFSKKKDIISSKVILGINLFCIGILVITVICIVILLAKKCMVFRTRNRKRRKHGHSKRKIIRHRTRAVLTVTTSVSVLGVFLLLGLQAGLFNKDAIMQNMQSSGYFRYAYSEYLAELVDEMAASDEAPGASTKIQSYEDYLFTIKQNTMKILEGAEDTPIPDSNVAPYVKNLENSYLKIIKLGGIALLLSGISGMVFMYFMDQQRERGMKHMAASFLITGMVLAVGVLILLFVKPYTYMYIEPDYLYLFLVACIKRFTSVMTSIMAFIVVMGMIQFGLFVTIKNRGRE